MSELPSRPDLDQLRRQARDRVRAGEAGTLASALHALAREHGFASWPRLKHDVESRTTAPTYVLRYVRTPAELRRLWNRVWGIFGEHDPSEERAAHWRVFERFDEQRHRNLVVERGDEVLGGALGLHLLALEPEVRGLGLGRRLLEAAEVEAMVDGVDELRIHVSPAEQPFFVHHGYVRRGGVDGHHLSKGAPSGRLRELRVQRWRTAVGDLDVGVALTPDPATGKVPSHPW